MDLKFELRDDVTPKEIGQFIALIVFLIIWWWFIFYSGFILQ
jgi:hypothetical protein